MAECDLHCDYKVSAKEYRKTLSVFQIVDLEQNKFNYCVKQIKVTDIVQITPRTQKLLLSTDDEILARI